MYICIHSTRMYQTTSGENEGELATHILNIKQANCKEETPIIHSHFTILSSGHSTHYSMYIPSSYHDMYVHTV